MARSHMAAIHAVLAIRYKVDQVISGTVIFSEQGERTLVTNTIRYASTQARDAAMSTGMAEGLEMGYQRLDQYLTQSNA